MADFYFDCNEGYVTVNGTLANSGFCADGDFALGYFRDGYRPLFVKIPHRITQPVSALMHITDLGKNVYFLNFSPCPETEEEAKIISQTSCSVAGVKHLVTLCKKGGFRLITETAEEIYETACPCALSNISVSATPLKQGHILKITADADGKKMLILLLYNGDYRQLFLTFCDSYCFEESDIVCVYRRGGCNGCVKTLRYRYKKGKFQEYDRSFLYRHDHCYPDELKPYEFAEKLLFGDENGAQEMLRRSFSVASAKEILGDFDAVADFDFLPYRPYTLTIMKRAPYCKARSYVFDVRDGIICDIRRL